MFYTPIDTPAHKKGWWAEMTFLHGLYYINRPPISKMFETKEEAQKFLNLQRNETISNKEILCQRNKQRRN